MHILHQIKKKQRCTPCAWASAKPVPWHPSFARHAWEGDMAVARPCSDLLGGGVRRADRTRIHIRSVFQDVRKKAMWNRPRWTAKRGASLVDAAIYRASLEDLASVRFMLYWKNNPINMPWDNRTYQNFCLLQVYVDFVLVTIWQDAGATEEHSQHARIIQTGLWHCNLWDNNCGWHIHLSRQTWLKIFPRSASNFNYVYIRCNNVIFGDGHFGLFEKPHFGADIGKCLCWDAHKSKEVSWEQDNCCNSLLLVPSWKRLDIRIDVSAMSHPKNCASLCSWFIYWRI